MCKRSLLGLFFLFTVCIWANPFEELSKNSALLDVLYPAKKQRTQFEKKAFRAGRNHFWQVYGMDDPENKNKLFKGYILHADPYHYAQKRISFLLGVDCSHFVHRLYQVLGFNFPFAKTRAWIDFAEKLTSKKKQRRKKQHLIRDLDECRSNQFYESLELIDPLKNKISSGDIVVIKKKQKKDYWHGHMGILLNNFGDLEILHAKGSTTGIVREKFSVNPYYEYFYFRVQDQKYKVLNVEQLSEALLLEYDYDNSGCN